MSEKPRRKHSAVIKNQNISGTKMLGEVPESIISERASPAVQDKHPRSRPIRERLLRNEFFGKMKIEIGDEHVSTILRATVNLFTTEARRHGASVVKSLLHQLSHPILNNVLPGNFAAIGFAADK